MSCILHLCYVMWCWRCFIFFPFTLLLLLFLVLQFNSISWEWAVFAFNSAFICLHIANYLCRCHHSPLIWFNLKGCASFAWNNRRQENYSLVLHTIFGWIEWVSPCVCIWCVRITLAEMIKFVFLSKLRNRTWFYYRFSFDFVTIRFTTLRCGAVLCYAMLWEYSNIFEYWQYRWLRRTLSHSQIACAIKMCIVTLCSFPFRFY